jgi:hypothetical protein
MTSLLVCMCVSLSDIMSHLTELRLQDAKVDKQIIENQLEFWMGAQLTSTKSYYKYDENRIEKQKNTKIVLKIRCCLPKQHGGMDASTEVNFFLPCRDQPTIHCCHSLFNCHPLHLLSLLFIHLLRSPQHSSPPFSVAYRYPSALGRRSGNDDSPTHRFYSQGLSRLLFA